MGFPPVVVVESGGVPRTQVEEGFSAPPFTVVESGARPITLTDNAPPIALFDQSGNHWAVLSAIGWDRTSYPLSITGSGVGGYSTDFDRNDYLPDSHFTTTFYVDRATGSDTNNGSEGSKFRSIGKAIQEANSAGEPTMILVTAGLYNRGEGPNVSGSIVPQVDIAIVAVGGRVVSHVADSLTWTVDGTYANLYSTTRSNVARITDPSSVDADGYYAEYAKYETPTALNNAGAVDGWAQDGPTLYVRRADGGVVSNSNARAYLNIDWIDTNSGSGSIYLENIDVEGGQEGCLKLHDLADKVVIAEGCTLRYPGTDVSYRNAIDIEDSSGLFAFVGCDFGAASKDGVGAHWYLDNTRQTFVLTVDCSGKDFGRGASVSNNALTGHETTVHVDVNGTYQEARGGTVRFINDSRFGCFGSSVADDLGPDPAGYRVDDAAVGYVIDCAADMASADDDSYIATETARLYVRDFTNTQGALGTSGVYSTNLSPS